MREQIEKALQAQRENGNSTLGQTLVNAGIISPKDLLHALATQQGMNLIDLAQIEVSPEALKRIPSSVARQYCVVPVRFEQGQLTVAMADPRNVTAIDELRFMLNCDVVGMLAPLEQVCVAIDRYYG